MISFGEKNKKKQGEKFKLQSITCTWWDVFERNREENNFKLQ